MLSLCNSPLAMNRIRKLPKIFFPEEVSGVVSTVGFSTALLKASFSGEPGEPREQRA